MRNGDLSCNFVDLGLSPILLHLRTISVISIIANLYRVGVTLVPLFIVACFIRMMMMIIIIIISSSSSIFQSPLVLHFQDH